MEVVQFIHSYWAYLVLLVLVLATFNALLKFFGGKEFNPKDFRISLFALITMHIQLLIGIVLWFTKGYFDELSVGEVMKNDAVRKLAIEHPTTMLIAVALVTIGYSKHKKKLVSKPKFFIASLTVAIPTFRLKGISMFLTSLYSDLPGKIIILGRIVLSISLFCAESLHIELISKIKKTIFRIITIKFIDISYIQFVCIPASPLGYLLIFEVPQTDFLVFYQLKSLILALELF